MASKNETIGLKIKELREDLNMSLRDFSKAIGIDNSTLGKIEKGKAGLPMNILLEICSKFSVSSDWILMDGVERFIVKPIAQTTPEDLLLKIYEAALNTKAYQKANAEMFKDLYQLMSKEDKLIINSKYSSLLARFLSEE